MRGLGQCLIALAFLASATTAAPAPVYHIAGSGTISLYGQATGAIHAGALESMQVPHQLQAPVNGAYWIIREQQVETVGSIAPGLPRLQFVNALRGLEPTVEAHGMATGLLQASHADHRAIRLFPSDAGGILQLHASGPLAMLTETSGSRQNQFLPSFPRAGLDPPSSAPQFTWAQQTVAGNVLAILYGGTITVPDSTGDHFTVQTGSRPAQTIPIGTNATLTVVDHVYVVLAGEQAWPDIQWIVWPEALALVGNMELTLTRAKIDGAPHPLISLAGRMQVSGDFEYGNWTVNGHQLMLRINGVAVNVHARTIEPTLAIVGSLATLIILGKASPHLAALIAAYTRAQPFSNDTRKRLWALVLARPGITAHELAHSLQVQRPTITFHTRVLERHGLLIASKIRRNWHFRAKGSPEPSQRDLLLRHEIRAHIVSLLADRPRKLGEMARALQRAPPLVAYHLTTLSKAGLVAKVHGNYTLPISFHPPMEVVTATSGDSS